MAETSKITCDEVISVMDIDSTKTKNAIATNASLKCHNKKIDAKLIAIFCT